MITVYKYHLDLYAEHILVPAGAELLSVGMQGGACYVWARVDTAMTALPPAIRRIRIVGTGHDLGEAAQWRFVGHIRITSPVLELFVFEES